MATSYHLRIKLVKLAVGTSLLVGGISIIPLFITGRLIPDYFVLLLLLIFSFNLFIIWIVNIFLTTAFDRYAANRTNFLIRYILSYIIGVSISGLYLMYVNSFQLAEMYLHPKDFSLAPAQKIYGPFFMAFFANSFILFIQELMMLRERKSYIELENAQLKIEKYEALNQQLKQHIHPHFLFNSLSILKSLIKNNPDVAEEYVVRLSDFLRVSISSNDANLVPLKDEIKMCQDFIEMQKIRFGDALIVNVNIPQDAISQAWVPGFSLQLLLENAIKHNVLTVTEPLVIDVSIQQDWLCVANKIQGKKSLEQSTRSGLINLSKRYKILSGKDINIEQNESTFKVSIALLNHHNIEK